MVNFYTLVTLITNGLLTPVLIGLIAFMLGVFMFYRLSLVCCVQVKLALALALSSLFVLQSSAAESPLWQQFATAKLADTEPTLPDFSYAGYDYSESKIPDTSSWTVFNVTDYGAVADDSLYDDVAIQSAIDAAESAGGGVVFFPAGRFMVSPNETVGENIFIGGSNILLKGSGSDQTEIFADKMKVDNGRYMFEIAPEDLGETVLTRVVSSASRESYEIEVADASNLSVGQRILLRTDSAEFAESYYAPQAIASEWTRLFTDGFRLKELHTVSAIAGNIITLREPLHINLTIGSDPIEVRSYNVLTNVGVEDILFKGNWDSYDEDFEHHKDDIHDYAWNALRLDNVANGWIRNCEFKDWNQGIYIDGAAALTLDNLLLSGKKGHASIHVRRSYGVLIKDSEDTAGHHHGPGVGYSGVGTVYLRYKMFSEQRIDSHSGSPYATLLDGVTNGQLYGSGGPHESYPHHGKYFVFWNFFLEGGTEHYDFWPDSRNGNTFAMPYFIGLQGKSVTMTEGTYGANELAGEVAEPASLFEAQLALRLENDNYPPIDPVDPTEPETPIEPEDPIEPEIPPTSPSNGDSGSGGGGSTSLLSLGFLFWLWRVRFKGVT